MSVHNVNWLRLSLQLLVLLLIAFFIVIFTFPVSNYNPEAYCPFGGLQSLSGYFVNNSLACDMTTVQVVLGTLLVILVILIGKLFCSYICPLGFVTELLYRLRKYLNFKELEIKNHSILDLLLRSIKYILLFITFYFSISSSELFCKIFDPYYSIATHFKGEMYIWVSIGVIYLLILGSMFIKMFWCKYICPLGALSNIFKYLYASVILILLYIGLNIAGVHVSWVILLIIFCAGSYIFEIFFPSKMVFSLLRINRDKTKCAEGCSKCILKCPYSIQINKVDKVTDIDCTLCGDCITECKQSALSINKQRRLHSFIPLFLIILIVVGIYFGKKWEMPTINLKWGDYKEKTLTTLEINNLRSVKCYASSMNFAKKIIDTKGIYGVRTFINHHCVRIFYNKNEIADSTIKRIIYSPVKFKIKNPTKDVANIKIFTFHTDNMPDPVDVNYLGMQFRQSDNKFYGLESVYSIPLTLRLYVDASENINVLVLKETVDLKNIVIQLHGGKQRIEKVDYKFLSLDNKVNTIPKRAFLEHFFKTYKKYFVEFDLNKCSKLEIIYPDLDKPLVYRALPTLANYLSSKNGILGLETTLNTNDEYIIRIYYSEKLINTKLIETILRCPKWDITTKNGNKTISSQFKF